MNTCMQMNYIQKQPIYMAAAEIIKSSDSECFASALSIEKIKEQTLHYYLNQSV